MPKQNIFTDVKDSILGELKTAKKKAAKSEAIPFGLERLTKESYVIARFEQMSAEERQEFISRNGVAETARMMSKRRSQNA